MAFSGMRSKPLASCVLLHLLVTAAGVERYHSSVSVHARAGHRAAHSFNDDIGNIEVSLDKRGMSHMRREPHEMVLFEDTQHHQRDSPTGEVGPEDPAQREVDAARAQQKSEEENAREHGAATQHIENIGDAEKELKKVDEVVVAAEEKAGLPDSTKTTPEPESREPTDEEQEGNALMIAAISIVVLIGAAAAGWSVWMARRMNSKAAEKTPLGGGDGEEYEAEGEEAAGEEAEAAGEVGG